MKLYIVYFSNGWSSMHIAETMNQAEKFAIESYGCWYDDEPYIERVEYRELEPRMGK